MVDAEPDTDAVADHYTHGFLLEAITAGVEQLQKCPATVTIDDLAAVDEFHIGGRTATAELVGQLDLGLADQVLDAGCGIGGTARYIATTHGCAVTGVDLTPEYITTGRALNEWVGLQGHVDLVHAEALHMPFDAGHFDAAVTLHTAMNIADKPAFFAEVHRVLRAGAKFAIYDVMRMSDEDLLYPVPWAAIPATSFLATPDDYTTALADAGFEVLTTRNRHAFATAFFENMRGRLSGFDGPPPLGLHIIFGEAAPIKLRNMVDNVTAGRIAPVEIIAQKRA